MHVMFIHPNFPAQFGFIADHLTRQHKWQCTFVTSIDTTQMTIPFTHVNYRIQEGPQPKVFNNPRNVGEHMAHMNGVYNGLRSAPQLKPDLVVGHMSYGTMLYLKNLYSCPFVGYYEILPPPFWSDQFAIRPEFPPPEQVRIHSATHHLFTYLHLHAVDAAYTPTHYQLSTAPPELRHKIRVVFDGVDTSLFKRRTIRRPAHFRGLTIGPNTRVVTYVSRGLESFRGFDIFMKVAKRIYQQLDDVVFLIAGDERTVYGHEQYHIGNQTFKQYVLSQDSYAMEKFHFLGVIPLDDLVNLYGLGDLHIYLTAPFVLSWSLVQAMSTGCTILGSATAPVQEVIDNGVQGILADFFDVEGLAEQAVRVLRQPEEFRYLGNAARQRVLERYDLKDCTDALVQLFGSTKRS